MRKRNIQIITRLNKEEHRHLCKLVKKSGVSQEVYVRHLINGVVPQDAPPPDYYAMMRELHGNIVETETSVTRTTLYIAVSHKTANEMADKYGFNSDQRKQLAELLADENNSMWSAVLYGIGTGDGEIVTDALSQLGNIGGEPYWSWYGFNSRVEWCACFVSCFTLTRLLIT